MGLQLVLNAPPNAPPNAPLIMTSYFLKTFDKTAALIVAFLIATIIPLSLLVPPLQSPDESDHIKRAYLLSKGTIILDNSPNKSSGGEIDTGLINYIHEYNLIKITKDRAPISADIIESASTIHWSGERTYDRAPGTGYYFPLIYAPQAMGLTIGEQLGLTIDTSYRLARAFSLLASCILIYYAFTIYPTNPLVLGLLSLPMYLFQLSSASLDSVATALALLVIAIYLRLTNKHEAKPDFLIYILPIAIALLVTSRTQLLPLFLLTMPFLLKNRYSATITTISIVFTLSWLYIAATTTVDLRVVINEPSSKIIAYYAQNPLKFFDVLWHTLSSTEIRHFYLNSFIGILGWLTIGFDSLTYNLLSLALLGLLVLSLNVRNIKRQWQQRGLLVIVSVFSILLTFFALLVTWTPHPANAIAGVQGRYFFIPSIILAYALTGSKELGNGAKGKLLLIFSFVFFVCTLTITTQLLINNYYLAPHKLRVERIILEAGDLNIKDSKPSPSEIVTPEKPITLHIPTEQSNKIGQVKRIGILFGTHMHQNHGQGELILIAEDGTIFNKKFNFHDLSDNQYKYFFVPANKYIKGEIKSTAPAFLSTFEIRSNTGRTVTCISYLNTDASLVFIEGCPH